MGRFSWEEEVLGLLLACIGELKMKDHERDGWLWKMNLLGYKVKQVYDFLHQQNDAGTHP